MERINPSLLAKAKDLYMAYKPVPEIAQSTGVNIKSVEYHARTWRIERVAKKNEFFEYVAENKKGLLLGITDNALNIISNGLKELARSGEALTVKDIRYVTEILESIDKIVKLDDGTPTDIHKTVAPSTIIELKRRLKADPFLENQETEDAEILTIDSTKP